MAKYYPWIPLLVLGIFYTYKAMDFPVHDFANYYFGGQFLAESHFNSKSYFPYEFNQTILASGHADIFASYAPNTPFLAVFFAPFSLVSIAIAKMIFNVLSLVLLLFSLYRLFSHYKLNPLYALLLPVLFLVPVKNSLLFGQVYFILFFLLAEGWLAYEKQYWKAMSLFWGLAILLKVFPALLIVFLVFKKQWKPLFCLMVSCLLLFGISILFTGIDIWFFYLSEVLPKASNGEIATAFVDNYQSVFMFLKRIFVYDSIENPYAFFHNAILFSAFLLAFKIGLLTVGYFISRKNQNVLFVFSYWILAMVLLSPYGSTYTFILLLFPFLAILKSDFYSPKKIVFFAVMFLINNLPLSLFIEKSFPFSYGRLFLLLFLFAFFLMQSKQEFNWKAITICSFVPMVLLLVFKKSDVVKSTVLLKDGPILLYDYGIQTHSEINYYFLTADFWDGKGKRMLWTPQKILIFKPLRLKNNQVFYDGKQLTFDRSHKLKPIVIDNKTVLYLSDYGRGIGFYTLRKINIK